MDNYKYIYCVIILVIVCVLLYFFSSFEDKYALVIVTSLCMFIFFVYIFYISEKAGYLKEDFSYRYIISLVLFIAAGVLTWFGLMLMEKRVSLKPNKKDFLALIFSIIIGMLTWARLIYTIIE